MPQRQHRADCGLRVLPRATHNADFHARPSPPARTILGEIRERHRLARQADALAEPSASPRPMLASSPTGSVGGGHSEHYDRRLGLRGPLPLPIPALPLTGRDDASATGSLIRHRDVTPPSRRYGVRGERAFPTPKAPPARGSRRCHRIELHVKPFPLRQSPPRAGNMAGVPLGLNPPARASRSRACPSRSAPTKLGSSPASAARPGRSRRSAHPLRIISGGNGRSRPLFGDQGAQRLQVSDRLRLPCNGAYKGSLTETPARRETLMLHPVRGKTACSY